MKLTKTLFPILLVLISASSACEWDTRVVIEDSNPPKFRLSGSGQLAMLKIQGQKVRDSPAMDAGVVWEITPKEGQFGGTGVYRLQSITYGEIPEGYVQKYPEQGKAPPLIEGQHYDGRFETVNANGTNCYFFYRNGRIVETDFRLVEVPR